MIYKSVSRVSLLGKIICEAHNPFCQHRADGYRKANEDIAEPQLCESKAFIDILIL